MKAQRKQPRNIQSLSTRRWAAYAAAGAASALTCANSAEAEIHYSGHVAVQLTGNAHASLPLSNGASLFFRNSRGVDVFTQTFTFQIEGIISGSARGANYGFGRIFLDNLRSGENVSGGKFYSVAGNPRLGVLFTQWSDGNFAAPARGFVGFRFNTGKGTQYGWARISTRDDIIDGRHHIRDLIKDYAWGDPGDAIIDAVQRSKADLLVVGRRGQSRLSALLLGSVSQKLASFAPCAVMVVP